QRARQGELRRGDDRRDAARDRRLPVAHGEVSMTAQASGRRELGDLVALAVPLTIGHLGHQLMTVVDAAILGHYHEASLGGAGVGGGILFALTVVGMGIVMGL